ncbi:MAG TPA: hypothetical protein VKR23_07275 [Gaiellaceae bacterium]|nr:hypothetical protein [Gaiellaceae bacterium]
MNRIVLAGIVCLAAVGSLSAHAASAGGAPPCTPKITKIQGHQAAANCGPATATLTINGKTYTFRNGFCEQSKTAAAALLLNLGTVVVGVKGNAGRPYLSITIGQTRVAAGVSGADYGGKDLLGTATPLIDVKGSIPAKGTFTQRIATGTKFTGSWNCNGVVYQAP